MIITFSREAERELADLDRLVAARVLDAIQRYAEAGAGDVKMLRGEKGIKRLCVGDYRVRLQTDGETVRVFDVAHRREAYR